MGGSRNGSGFMELGSCFFARRSPASIRNSKSLSHGHDNIIQGPEELPTLFWWLFLAIIV